MPQKAKNGARKGQPVRVKKEGDAAKALGEPTYGEDLHFNCAASANTAPLTANLHSNTAAEAVLLKRWST